LTLGFDPNFADNDKRIPLHHLVFYSANLDGSPEACKLLLEFGCKINALDKYERSPIFYCFSDMEDHILDT
jgi:ankyrin repeat protein